jgi:ubiquinone/menaquinone biosynthesis C-methylase UbiE
VSAYQSRYAQFYDLIYADKGYAEEVAFLDRELRTENPSRGRTWLDVACGTGNHAIELARRGYDVTGLDYSSTQLDCARAKRMNLAPEERERLLFVEGDMCTFDLKGRQFDVISCLFDSLGYAVSNERIIATLQCMRRHLADDGRIVLEFWHAAAMLTGYDPVRVRRFPSPQGELMRTSNTTIDVVRQTCSVKFTLAVPQGDSIQELSETHVCRFFLLQEMGALLDSAGLTLQRAYAGFDADSPIKTDTWHIVGVARAKDA